MKKTLIGIFIFLLLSGCATARQLTLEGNMFLPKVKTASLEMICVESWQKQELIVKFREVFSQTLFSNGIIILEREEIGQPSIAINVELFFDRGHLLFEWLEARVSIVFPQEVRDETGSAFFVGRSRVLAEWRGVGNLLPFLVSYGAGRLARQIAEDVSAQIKNP